MSEKSYEETIAEYESERNDAMDRWFAARPHIEWTRENEKIFEAGFRMAWEIKSK